MASRISNSFKNLFSGMMTRGIMMILSFLVRTVFVATLSAEYLGVNGLFSNILTVLSLAELGFSTAMVYSLYEPLAHKDKQRISGIMQLYKKVYCIIGLIVLGVGLLIVPFLDHIVANRPDIDSFVLIYILYLLNTALSYFTGAYKKSILVADQKQYIVNLYSNLSTFIKSILQIAVLIIFKNSIFYTY